MHGSNSFENPLRCTVKAHYVDQLKARLFQQLFFVETSNHYYYSMFILKMGINHRLAQYDQQKKIE
jgi:hypothetical protein